MTARIAIIGCGAVTENAHLPALRRLGHTPVLLVDADLERARGLADAFGVPEVAREHQSASGAFDAAIVATPNRLHATISRELLLAGVHVLVEKPMGHTSQECMDMVAAAGETGVVLMIGLRRRFVFASEWMKRLLVRGGLGKVESFDIRDGVVFGWPVVSPAVWRRDLSGGGALMDTGSHTLDQLLWWFGPVKEFEYFDDARGGVEADCLLKVTMESGAKGTVELSRTRDLRNSAIVRGTRGQVEVGLDQNWAECRLPGVKRFPRFPKQGWDDAFPRELENWLAAIAGVAAPGAPGSDGAATIALIEACYAARQPLTVPWEEGATRSVSSR